MAINYDQIKVDMAKAIADAMAATVGDGFAKLPASGSGITATWAGTNTVLVPDTSLLQVGNFIRSDADGNWFKIASIIPNVSVSVLDTFGVGAFPTGGAALALAQTITWGGTNILTLSDTSGISPGESIRLDTDGQWFTVGEITPNTSLFILNPFGFIIPTGSTSSSKSGSTFMTVAIPDPPDGDKLVAKFGEPIAIPVVDEGFIHLASQPTQLWNRTLAEISNIAFPAPGSMVFATDATGGSIPVFFDGFAWRRIDTRDLVS